MVKNCLSKFKLNDIKVKPIIAMGNPFNYRNKLQYPCGIDKDGKPVMGVFANRSHEIIPVESCQIQNELSEKIAKDVFNFLKENNTSMYDEKNLKGAIRHIIIRIGIITNEVMLILVVNEDKINKQEELVSYITSRYPEIKTIVKNFNTKNTNVILGNKNETIFGEGYIYDFLGEYKFKISPLSFYQTNPVQTEALYNKALDYAELTGKETVLDLYCGIGTIGIFAAKKAKQVYGIEVIENAVKDAKENAEINNVKNAEFYLGEVENILEDILEKNKVKPDVVFVDPPRKGLDNKTIEILKDLMPKKIVYVSCNPATLARDLKLLEEKYNIKEITPVDMFPYTKHIETVSVLIKKQQ